MKNNKIIIQSFLLGMVLFFVPVVELASGFGPTCTLTADPANITSGQPSVLTLISADATSASIDGIGSVSLNSTTTVNPTLTTTYIARVVSGGAQRTCQATVSVSVVYCKYEEARVENCVEVQNSTECTSDPYYGTVVSACPREEEEEEEVTGNAAEKIDVVLQIPLPFVETNCTKQVRGKSVPAVCNLSDYLKGVYRLVIGAGILFAIVMIIIAGYQWIFSGGSADKTGAAKKRIFNAVIGLMLALLSYIILNAITPRLVEMRLPKVTPVQRYDWSESFCNENTQVQEACRKLTYCLAEKSATNPLYDIKISTTAQSDKELECGKTYYFTNVIGATNATSENIKGECNGGYCSDDNDNCVSGKCISELAHGNITYPLGKYVDEISIMLVCKESKDAKIIASKEVGYGKTSYIIPFSASNKADDFAGIKNYAEEECGGTEKVRGFIFKVEVNDAEPAIDDDFALGKDSNGKCLNEPFRNNSASCIKADDPETNNCIFDFSEIDFKTLGDDKLFTMDDLDKGINCNIDDTSWILDDGS